MAATTQTPEQRELSLIGKVEMRIALADSDAKLESTLKTYLSPLLLKLASEHIAVRNKVITVCQHISTRTKPQSIQLPVAALVKQFKDQENSIIRHFDLVYIQQGITRLSRAEKAELLPIVVKGISKSGSHGPTIFNLLLRLLEFFVLPLRGSKEDVELRTQLEISEEDASYLASWLGKFILFTPPAKAPAARPQGLATARPNGTASPAPETPNRSGRPSPGLSSDDFDYITVQGKENLWDPAQGGVNLTQTKILAAKLLASGLFNDKERFFPALFASADSASTISDVGDDMMKRALPVTDLESETLIKQMFDLYFGSAEAQRVRPPLRLKVLGLLSKSTLSTGFSHPIMKLVEDGISSARKDGDDTVMSNSYGARPAADRETTKLRAAIFSYINFVARHGPAETLEAIAPTVVGRLKDFIENQGWPTVGQNEDLISRAYAYEVIGLLAKASPKNILLEPKDPTLEILPWLFISLASDTSGNSITVSIEEALSSILTAMARLELTEAQQIGLEDLLINEMEQSNISQDSKRLRSTRYVAIRFANRCLPYSSVKARWIDVLGLGATGDRGEVKEEAERGLSAYWYQMLNGSLGSTTESEKIECPTFEGVMGQFFPGRTTDEEMEPLAVARYARRSNPTSFEHMSSFARRMLFNEALKKSEIPITVDNDWERRIDTTVESDEKAREAVRTYIESLTTSSGSVVTLLEALFVTLTDQANGSGESLVQFLAISSNELVQKLVAHTEDLMKILQSNNHSRRTTAAQAYGILASHPAADASKTEHQVRQLFQIAETWSSAIGAAANQAHGAIVALGFFLSRCALRGIDVSKSDLYKPIVKTLLDILTTSKDSSLKEAACTAMGQLAMLKAISPAIIEEVTKVREVIDKLYEMAKTGDEPAILCLGQLSMILPEDTENTDSELAHLEEQLHKLHEIRQGETHFTVGEAYSYLTCGWQSKALATKLDIVGATPPAIDRSSTLSKVMDRILKDCSNTKPALKKAAVMWLLCLLQFCGEQPELQARLPNCQLAFKRCLSDRDELIQESASRGLGLVYEKGDRKLKDDLVRDLVSSFSSDRQSQLAGNVSADTQLFEPGALPTGDGSVSTYKDIMSLASEVGDSSLVYRFMAMASSNAIWSSRAAFGRFGLSNVLSDSSVDGYLADNPKLYPKLFRYRFDPNSGVQRSMNDIWNALVKDSTATIDKYFDDIMEDLLTSILGKEWRVRQASCAAIGDLVQGRALEKYEKYIERIWTQCFKVLDDIKESVRTAAGSLARVLTGVLTRALEADHSSTKNASTMLKHVLPFLLSGSGMESSAEDVRLFSVRTLLEIIKKSNGKTLRPFIPELVERLIGSLSSLEPEAVNYLHLNASKYNLTEQKIDDMRLSSVRSSPLMEAIERCLDLLDDETMQRLQPKLESAMKTAVGLPSKVGSSRVLVSLSTRRLGVFRPFADANLKLLEKVMLDRNETVSSSHAVAAGYVARAASDKQILHLMTYAQNLYFESEGDRESSTPRRSLTAGEVMFATAKHASDRFNALAASALPFIFVAKHDPNEHVKEQFQNAWDEAVGGSRAVALYLTEIVKLCTTYLDSPQWVLKHTSARAVADCVTAVASLESEISSEAASTLWPALEKALGGKTWEGKETVLQAFVKFVQAAPTYTAQNSSVAAAIVKIATREAKRQNAAYRPHALHCLAEVCQARHDVDMGEEVFGIVEPLLSEIKADDDSDGDAMVVDGDAAGQKTEDLKHATRAAAIDALFGSINPTNNAQWQTQVSRALGPVATLSSTSASASIWRSSYKSLQSLFKRIDSAGGAGTLELQPGRDDLHTILFGRDPGTEALRLLRAEAIAGAADVAGPGLKGEVRAWVVVLVGGERSKQVQTRLKLLL